MISRERILEIAKENMLEYVHQTYLVRFTEQIVEECCNQLAANGYDDASNVLKKDPEL